MSETKGGVMWHIGAHKALLLFIVLAAVCAWGAPEQQRRAQAEPRASAPTESSARSQGRLKPREDLGCDVNDTTSFMGRVLSYSRNSRRVLIRLRTDEATTEQFSIAVKNSSSTARVFLFKGEAFKPEDWRKIESRARVLKAGMRATVWACYVRGEPRAKLIDWQPRETGTGSVY